MQTTKVRRLRIPVALVVTVLATGVGAISACSSNVESGSGGAMADAGKEGGMGGAQTATVETVGISG